MHRTMNIKNSTVPILQIYCKIKKNRNIDAFQIVPLREHCCILMFLMMVRPHNWVTNLQRFLATLLHGSWNVRGGKNFLAFKLSWQYALVFLPVGVLEGLCLGNICGWHCSPSCKDDRRNPKFSESNLAMYKGRPRL